MRAFSLKVSAPSRLLLVDDKAILTDQNQQYVYVVGPGNVAHRKDVVTGGMADGLRLIRSGLAPGDRVIVSGFATDLFPRRSYYSQRCCHGISDCKQYLRSRSRSQQVRKSPIMDFSKFFIDRPIFAIVLSIVIFFSPGLFRFRCFHPENIPK